MPKPTEIELPTRETIPILYEDRSVMAIDKPPGWMLVPFNWQKTTRNLQAALTSSIAAGDFWARSRNLKLLRPIHRLDSETTGILLLAKSRGAVDSFSNLFESRQVEKVYLAVVVGVPKESAWTCQLAIAQDQSQIGKMKIDMRGGKSAETSFRVLQQAPDRALVEAKPVTGRTHQIRVHLAAAGHPVFGDEMYGEPGPEQRRATKRRNDIGFALRAVSLSYADPFTRRSVRIQAPREGFLKQWL